MVRLTTFRGYLDVESDDLISQAKMLLRGLINDGIDYRSCWVNWTDSDGNSSLLFLDGEDVVLSTMAGVSVSKIIEL